MLSIAVFGVFLFLAFFFLLLGLRKVFFLFWLFAWLVPRPLYFTSVSLYKTSSCAVPYNLLQIRLTEQEVIS